jgi:signal transduction histidine kinase
LHIGNQDTDNERFYHAFASVVRITPDEASHVAIVMHDVTHHKMEERARTEFISMVSHELRNPLQTLNGFLKVVQQGQAGELNELQQEFLDLANQKADLLKHRIRDLLEYNRLEGGRLRMQPRWADLQDLIMETGNNFQLQAAQRELHLHFGTESDLPQLLIDRERVGQVLTNLVENAMKATPAGGCIEIGVRLREHDAVVFVRDTGIGIPQEQQERIFRRFYRLGQHESSYGGNLGLGLSICQQIIEAHNGRIWVESQEGQGSTFSFALPLVAREQTLEVEYVS